MKNNKDKTINVDGVPYTPEKLEKLIEENGYSPQWEDDNEELGVCEMINPENDQHLITAICEKIEIAYNEAIVATTATGQYHNWTAPLPPMITLSVIEEETEEEFDKRLEVEIVEYEKEAKKQHSVIIGIDRKSIEIDNSSEDEYIIHLEWEVQLPY